MVKQLDDYLKAFRSLNVNKAGGVSPHKPCMLLAMLGLAEAGDLKENRIRFDPALLERYMKFFAVVRRDSDHANPHYPYFHLKSEGFWHLQPLAGRDAVLEAMTTARSIAAVTNNIAWVSLDAELHALVLDKPSRIALREELLVAWFGSKRQILEPILAEELDSDRYETLLRDSASGEYRLSNESPPEPARSAAFRRIVSENYDYRCAASGWRIILPEGRVMVEAAHLIPFAETHDDDPRNGIALAPTFHWALDAHVIAPGPDYAWHVSSALDERVADNQPLLALRGTSLMLPKEKALWPKEEALEWRLRRLLV